MHRRGLWRGIGPGIWPGPVKALVEHGAEVPDHLDEAELDKIDKMLRRFAALDRKRARVEKGQQTE